MEAYSIPMTPAATTGMILASGSPSVEHGERPLEFVDRKIIEERVHQMRDRKVTFRLGEAVESVALSEGRSASS